MAPDDTSFDSIFCGAIEIASSEDRAAFIARACGSDEELRRRVERLIDAHFQAGSFLESPPASATLAVGSAPSTDGSGTVIGPYKLLQPIGEGGMGTVYMAEQTQPVRRTVALKLIKAGMDSRQVLARFGAERQALALMDHPNIAKVFDAGTTDAGRPYFVMELVRGIPITRFCDERRLTLRERLELAIPICQAVQHAHQKGIIHRDLKPSNVLIALYDGKPVPKVIDFGVAKATGPRLTDQTLYTEFGAVVGTLEYMSPEQAELNQLDIDTRSDIYSLGVLLYELLTGSTPLEHKRLKEVLFLEILRVIREEESPRPSMRLSTTEELPSIAACRHIEPRKLSGLVRGELDWIVMKALEKDRNRRYETANGLAADLRRYLDDEPVQACPPSARYRLGKFARKHRAALVTVAGFALLLMLGAVVSTWQAVVATRANRAAIRAEANTRQERDRAIKAEGQANASANQARTEAAIAEAVNNFLQNDLLAEASPERNARNKKVTVEELLGRAAARIAGRFDQQPRIEAAIRLTIGDTYHRLGDFSAAQPHLERAWELCRRVLGEDQPDTLICMNNLAWLYQALAQYAMAESLFVKTLAIQRRVLGEEHPDTLMTTNGLASLYWEQGQLAKAEPLFVKGLETCRRVHGEDHPHTLKFMNNVALLYRDQGRFPKAEPLFVKTLEAYRRLRGEEYPETLTAMNNLALLYKAQGELAKAEPLYVKALEGRRRVLGEEHPDTLMSMNNLAALYQTQVEFAKAERLYVKALEVSRRVQGEEHPATLTSMNNLANLYRAQGEFAKAGTLFAKALEVSRRVKGEEHPHTLTTMNNLALLHYTQAEFAKAEPVWVNVLKVRRRVLGEKHPDTLTSINNLAALYQAQGQFPKAEPLYREVLEKTRQRHGEASRPAAGVLASLGENLLKQQKYADAELLLRECLKIREAELPRDWTTFNTRSMLGRSLFGQKKYAEAEPLLIAAYEGMKNLVNKVPSQAQALRLQEALERLIQLYDAFGKPEKAAQWRKKLPALPNPKEMPTEKK